MTYQTGRFAAASAAVCSRDGAPLGGLGAEELVAMQREIGEARRALDVLAAHVAGAVQTLADSDPGPGGIARKVGYKSARDMIADTLGTSQGEAQRLVNVGKALSLADAVEGSSEGPAGEAAPGWPLVAAALREAEITVEKAEIITKTLDALRAGREAEEQFVAIARRLKPYDLRRVCAREQVLRDPDNAEARERRLYEARELNLSERMDGMTVVQGLLDPASAGHFRAWLDAQVKAGFQARRDTPGDARTATQMRVDALAMLAHHAMDCDASGSGVKTTLVVRTTVEAIESGLGAATCDSMHTPISISTLRAMAVDAQVLPVVMGGDSVPLDMGYAKRCATAFQRLALLERDGGCAWCHAPGSYCDAHHIRWWRRDRGRTDMDNLVMLCVSCHHLMHYGDWKIEVEKGVVWFTPPPAIDPTRTRRKGGLAHLELAA